MVLPPPPASIAAVAQKQYQRQKLFLFVVVLLRQHESYSPVSLGKMGSQVSVVTGPWTGQQRYRGSVLIKVLFSILHWCPSRLVFNAYRGSFPIGKMPGSSPSFSAEVKNDGSYPSTAPYTFLVCTVLAVLLPSPGFVVNLVL